MSSQHDFLGFLTQSANIDATVLLSVAMTTSNLPHVGMKEVEATTQTNRLQSRLQHTEIKGGIRNRLYMVELMKRNGSGFVAFDHTFEE